MANPYGYYGGNSGGGGYTVVTSPNPIPISQVTGLTSWMDLVDKVAGKLDARIEKQAKTIRIQMCALLLLSVSNLVTVVVQVLGR